MNPLSFKNLFAALICAAAFLGGLSLCYANLNEEHFQFYLEGPLHGQQGWDANVPEPDRALVVENGASGEKQIEFKGNARIVKKFPIAESKVIVSFDFIPGRDTLDGRFYFDQADSGSVFAISFLQGTIQLYPANQENITQEVLTTRGVDSGFSFDPEKSVHIDLLFDFQAHTTEVRLEGRSLGVYEIAPTFTHLSLLNLWAGGEGFVSVLSNLVVSSVDQFPDEVQQFRPKK